MPPGRQRSGGGKRHQLRALVLEGLVAGILIRQPHQLDRLKHPFLGEQDADGEAVGDRVVLVIFAVDPCVRPLGLVHLVGRFIGFRQQEQLLSQVFPLRVRFLRFQVGFYSAADVALIKVLHAKRPIGVRAGLPAHARHHQLPLGRQPQPDKSASGQQQHHRQGKDPDLDPVDPSALVGVLPGQAASAHAALSPRLARRMLARLQPR